MWIFLDKEVFGEVYYLYLDRLNEVQIFVRDYFGSNIFHCCFAWQGEDTKEQNHLTCQQAKTQGLAMFLIAN